MQLKKVYPRAITVIMREMEGTKFLGSLSFTVYQAKLPQLKRLFVRAIKEKGAQK